MPAYLNSSASFLVIGERVRGLDPHTLPAEAIRSEQSAASPAITSSQSADTPATPKINAARAIVAGRTRFARSCLLARFSSSSWVGFMAASPDKPFLWLMSSLKTKNSPKLESSDLQYRQMRRLRLPRAGAAPTIDRGRASAAGLCEYVLAAGLLECSLTMALERLAYRKPGRNGIDLRKLLYHFEMLAQVR
jgi:hypothetical protein